MGAKWIPQPSTIFHGCYGWVVTSCWSQCESVKAILKIDMGPQKGVISHKTFLYNFLGLLGSMLGEYRVQVAVDFPQPRAV